ncbi:MAG: DUF4258 domain-containing protein [Allosphingosinicella sp.]
MADEPNRQVLDFRPREGEMEAIIREIATADRHVYLGSHTRDRMLERGISRLDAVRVLQRGSICGRVEPGKNRGEWKCKVVARLKGSREIGVVTIIVKEKRLFVKTVEWEDLS